MLRLHLANSPPHDFSGPRGGLALAWLYHTGHAFAQRVAWCGANHLLLEPASSSLLCTLHLHT